ncbi:MAG: metallopeptidase TldD-related protein [Firmicutes bacterium]|nr:metallopeptidase TldD-related protein [Bacillota bacterium]
MSDNLHNIAEYALNALTKAGAQKASCSVHRGRTDELNVEANEFSLLRTLFSDGLNLKALIDGRKGTASVNKLDKASIDKAVADCVALAASATPDEAEDIAPKAENKNFDATMGGSDMDKLFARTKEFLDQTKDEFPQIILESVGSTFNFNEACYVNSNGVEFGNKRESYHFNNMFSAKDGELSSSFNYYGFGMQSLDTPFMNVGLQRSMLQDSVKSLKTRMVDGKFDGKVIVLPSAGDMIWWTILGCFLDDYTLISDTSRWKDALGTKVADSKLTFSASPLNPNIVGGERYTGDGFESQNFDFIRDGVLNSFALSLYGANKTGKPRALNTAFGNVEVAAGTTPLADMIKSIDKGIVLGRFSGASPGPSGDVSGVAKNSFLIENGEVTDALGETMLSFNICDALMNIPAISQERCIDGYSILPWCCFDGITISGK